MKMHNKKIVIVGTGYVGLVLGTCIANSGLKVTCIDIDKEKIRSLESGVVPIYEPNLETMIKENYGLGRLDFHTNIKSCIGESKIIFFALGTPVNSDGKSLLEPLFQVFRDISPYLDDHILIIKSTVPVGTSRKITETINDLTDKKFSIVVNPEFLREGSAVDDFMKPDRIVIGSDDTKAQQIMTALYKQIYKKLPPIVSTTPETAEIIKSTTNAFLAMKISFINQIADLCEKTNGNILDTVQALGLDHRICGQFLQPGPGYGGSCFPKDTNALLYIANKVGVSLDIVKTTITANEKRKASIADKILKIIGNPFGKTIAILGLTFKANTDDIRESPALTIIPILQKAGVHIKAFDPQGMENCKPILQVQYTLDPYSAIKDSSAVIILTEWQEFKKLDIQHIKNIMTSPTIIDFRNIYDCSFMKNQNINYFPLGISNFSP